MKRLFGTGRKEAPAPALADTSAILEKRGDHLDAKLAKLDQELLGYREQLKKTPPGPAQARVRQKALGVLKQKKMYEQQRGVLANQQWNMDQLQFHTETTRATIEQVNCMKQSAQILKKEMKKMDVGSIEDLQDELADLCEDATEIQEIMARAYGVPDGLDEDDLEAELAALGQDMAAGDASYLDEALGNPAAARRVPAPQPEETDPDRLEQQLGLGL